MRCCKQKRSICKIVLGAYFYVTKRWFRWRLVDLGIERVLGHKFEWRWRFLDATSDQVPCMCLTAAFMLDSAPAGKSIHSSESGINLLLLSSARLAPLGSLLWNLLQPCCSFALEGKWIGMHCGRAIWSVTKCLGIGVGSYFENVDSSKST